MQKGGSIIETPDKMVLQFCKENEISFDDFYENKYNSTICDMALSCHKSYKIYNIFFFHTVTLANNTKGMKRFT